VTSLLRPEIAVALRAADRGDIDYDSVRMWVNGEEVTRDLELGIRTVTYRPHRALDPGLNRVRVTVPDQDGNTVTREWSFRVR